MTKVAIITGGASGMGLAVAEALAKRENWKLHLIDLNEERGKAAASAVKGKFHKVDVTSYQDLASAFDNVHKEEQRLDFVFANAGIMERWNFYDKQTQTPPPEPDQFLIDVNLKSVVSTTYLAQHYFRLSTSNYGTGEQVLVMTSSAGGFYGGLLWPLYCAAKHGVVGLMRSVAQHFFIKEGIRVNCINPGPVRTNIMDPTIMESYPPHFFGPVEKIAEVVLLLIDGKRFEDNKGKEVKDGEVWGKAIEIYRDKHYMREQIEYVDEDLANILEASGITE